MQHIQPDATVAEIVEEDERTANVFLDHGIDFCCGGDQPLRSACKDNGADLEQVRRELEELQDASGGPNRYSQWSLGFLADYIVNEHHAYVRETIPKLETYAEKVAHVHGGAHPETRQLLQVVRDLATEMKQHIAEEEDELFPRLKEQDPEDLDADALDERIDAFRDDHEQTADNLARIKELTDGFTPPKDACRTFRALYANLEEFDEQTRRHVHLENHVLFERAREQAKQAAR